MRHCRRNKRIVTSQKILAEYLTWKPSNESYDKKLKKTIRTKAHCGNFIKLFFEWKY